MTVQTHSGQETQSLGKKFASKIEGGGVVALFGELGAGKTTFVQGVAQGLGLKEKIISPTYILIRRYNLPKVGEYFYHIDLYRLENLAEVKDIGVEEILSEKGSIVLIEWPEKITTLLPKSHYEVKLTQLDDTIRQIEIKNP